MSLTSRLVLISCIILTALITNSESATRFSDNDEDVIAVEEEEYENDDKPVEADADADSAVFVNAIPIQITTPNISKQNDGAIGDSESEQPTPTFNILPNEDSFSTSALDVRSDSSTNTTNNVVVNEDSTNGPGNNISVPAANGASLLENISKISTSTTNSDSFITSNALAEPQQASADSTTSILPISDPVPAQNVALASGDSLNSNSQGDANGLENFVTNIDVGGSTALKRSPLKRVIDDDDDESSKRPTRRMDTEVGECQGENCLAKRNSRATKKNNNDKSKRNNYRKLPFGAGLGSNNKVRRKFPLVFCDLEKDSGIICPGVRRGNYMDQFFFDPAVNRCQHFVYNGCGGNANRFSSLWECNQSCAKKNVIDKRAA